MNTKGTKGDINFDMKELFKYINGGTSTIGMETKSELVRTIDGYVRKFNSNNIWREGAMNLRMLLQDNYDQGVEDAEAKAEARIAKAEAKAQKEIAKAKEEKACNIRNFYSQGLSIETIAKGFSMTEAEVQNILSAK